jgi:DNA-binding PadR family transcriptional regulator
MNWRANKFWKEAAGAVIWGAQSWPGEPRRARRGDVKFLLLEVLAERSAHGYDIIRDLESRREGYRPSAGSVYPTLQMLEDGGFVTSQTVDGKRVYTITDAGRELLAGREAEPGEAGHESPFCAEMGDVKAAAFKLAAAVMQTVRAGDPETMRRAREILDRARKELYGILAETS